MFFKTDVILLQNIFYQFQYFITTCLYMAQKVVRLCNTMHVMPMYGSKVGPETLPFHHIRTVVKLLRRTCPERNLMH